MGWSTLTLFDEYLEMGKELIYIMIYKTWFYINSIKFE